MDVTDEARRQVVLIEPGPIRTEWNGIARGARVITTSRDLLPDRMSDEVVSRTYGTRQTPAASRSSRHAGARTSMPSDVAASVMRTS